MAITLAQDSNFLQNLYEYMTNNTNSKYKNCKKNKTLFDSG